MRKTDLTIPELSERLRKLAKEPGTVFLDQIPEVLQEDFMLFIRNQALTESPNGRTEISKEDMLKYYRKVMKGEGISYEIQFYDNFMTVDDAKRYFKQKVDLIIDKNNELTFWEAVEEFLEECKTFLYNITERSIHGWLDVSEDTIKHYNDARLAQEQRMFETYRNLRD